MNELLALLGLALVLVLKALLVAAGNAIKNSPYAREQQVAAEDIPGARLARRLARQTTRFLLSIRLGNGLLRLLALVLALAAYVSLASANGGVTVMGVAATMVAAWLISALVSFLAEGLALRNPSRLGASLSPVVAGMMVLLWPFVWLLQWFSSRIARPQDGQAYPLVTEEQIMTMVEAGEEGGVIEQDERKMIYSIFQLGDTLAREVMVPRIDIMAFGEGTTMVEATDALLQSGYSRAPVYSRSIDNIIGLVYIKDLLAAWRKGKKERTVANLLREAYFVPEAKKLDDLLTEMQVRRVQMAVVVDEYGGTAGVVTFEDIVEEIVGEIQDEYDTAEEMPYFEVREGEYVVRGRIDLDDLNQIMGADLPKETSETVGGFIYSYLGKVPSPGDVVEASGVRMVVEQVTGRRIRKVRVSRIAPISEPTETGSNETPKSTS
jgi:CBS domain containing-hemolysin-like protein